MSLNYLSVVDTFFIDRPAGTARVAWDVACMVRDLGHHVTVFCQSQHDVSEKVCEYDGISVVRYALPKVHTLDPLKMVKRIHHGATVAHSELSHRAWDIVHIHSPVEGNIVYSSLGKGPRYLSTVHSPSVMEQEINWPAQGVPGRIKKVFGMGQIRRLERNFLKRSEKIQTLSRFTRNAIDIEYGVSNKIIVIPHWYRSDFSTEYTKQEARRKLGWPEDAKIIFTLRRLVPRMGLDLAIRAIAPLFTGREDLLFIIAGEGKLEQQLKSIAASVAPSNKIRFLGQVDDAVLKRCYEAADLFLLPTKALECFGLIIIEALSFGLPVLASDAAAIPELITPIMPEFIVPAGKEDALLKKLECWLSGKITVPSSEILRKYVAKNYSEEIVQPRMKAFLGIDEVTEVGAA